MSVLERTREFAILMAIGTSPLRLRLQVAVESFIIGLLGTGGGLHVVKRDFSIEPWYGSALVARARATVSHWDVTVQGGKVYGGWQMGGGFSGEAGPLGLRGEATYSFADGGGTFRLPDPDAPTGLREAALVTDHGSLVLGVDHRFEADEAECVFGAVLGLGARPGRDAGTGRLAPGSEFGSAPGRYFAEVIFYF